LHFLDDGINTEGSMGRMVITILTAVAEAERARILERTNEGRIDARLKGIRFGRKRKIDRAKLLQLQEQGVTGTALAKKMNISRTAVYNILKEKTSEAIRR
jgi:DNA invertase Pin-like site-specific DNA recombinase